MGEKSDGLVSHLRGHPIVLRDRAWRFVDTGEPAKSTWKERPCGHCGQHNTPEGHDACLGELPGVANACCGHGSIEEAYVQFSSGGSLRGADALAWTERH